MQTNDNLSHPLVLINSVVLGKSNTGSRMTGPRLLFWAGAMHYKEELSVCNLKSGHDLQIIYWQQGYYDQNKYW